MNTVEVIFSIFLGVGLASASGFRVFLPLLVLSLAGYFDFILLNESWIWVGSPASIVTLSAAALIEIFAYYIPWVDNILDSIALPLAGIAGTAVVLATVGDLNPIATWALAIIAGGGTAAAIKGSAASLRLTSTVASGGLANPIVSTIETGSSLLMALVSILLAPLAFILVIAILYVLYRFSKKLRKNKPPVI